MDEFADNDKLRKLAEALAGMPVGEPTARAFSVTMEPYVTLTATGIKAEGEPMPYIFATMSEAMAGYLKSVIDYLAEVSRGGSVLYWRHHPEIKHQDGRWQVYSRLLISNKPVQIDETRATGDCVGGEAA